MAYQPLLLHKDNPFKERIEKRIQTSPASDSGVILNETVTITRERQYIRGPWVKLSQDKIVLGDLSPWAWKILGYIAMNLNMNQEKIKLNPKLTGIDRRMFTRSMLELLSNAVIANTGVRGWYWLNVSILIMGTVNKHE